MAIGEIVTKEWILTNPKRGWSLNAERTWHYHKRNNEVRKWREFFKEEALTQRIPRLKLISIEVFSTFGTRALQDPGNNMPAVKAAVDGLTDAGIIPDDIPEHVLYIKFNAPTYQKGYDSVTLVVRDEL